MNVIYKLMITSADKQIKDLYEFIPHGDVESHLQCCTSLSCVNKEICSKSEVSQMNNSNYDEDPVEFHEQITSFTRYEIILIFDQ